MLGHSSMNTFLIIISLVITGHECESKSECFGSWKSFNGFCYLPFEGLPSTYARAKKVCRGVQSTLVSVTSLRENYYLTDLIQNRSTLIWLGMENGNWINNDLMEFSNFAKDSMKTCKDVKDANDCRVVLMPRNNAKHYEGGKWYYYKASEKNKPLNGVGFVCKKKGYITTDLEKIDVYMKDSLNLLENIATEIIINLGEYEPNDYSNLLKADLKMVDSLLLNISEILWKN